MVDLATSSELSSATRSNMSGNPYVRTSAAAPESPVRKLVDVPAATVRAGDWIRDGAHMKVVARVEGIQAHLFGGPYSPVLSYSYEFEPCRLYSAKRLCVKAGRLVSVWRLCD